MRLYHAEQLMYICLIILLFIVQNIYFFPGIFRYIPLALALIPVGYEALKLLFKGKVSTEFFLVVATGIAILGNEETAITVVLIIMLIAHYIEHLLEERTEDALKGLVQLIPTDVLVQIDNQEKVIRLEEVKPGMKLIIKTGGRIPVDGRIVMGHASIQEAVLTGESASQEKKIGELVFAGTYVETGSITIEAQKIGENTLFGKISKLLEEAGESKAKVVRLTDRITSLFTPLFLIFCCFVWFFTHNIKTIITVLIFGSPLELALVTPLTFLAALVAAFRKGILIKRSNALELLAKTDTIIFDKTGTLTMGMPEVVSIVSLRNAYTAQDILLLAAIAEKKSGHILARAILQEAQKEGLAIPDPTNYVSLTGHGVSVEYKGVTYLLGNRNFIESAQYGNMRLPAECEEKAADTTFYLATTEQVIGQICLVDSIRPEAFRTIAELKEKGMRDVILLSGDKQQVAEKVGQQLGIEKAYGGILPHEKLSMLKSLQDQHHVVAMVGDGINDAPALKQANVGIALGWMGMEPAIAAADIVLMSANLNQVVFLYDLARATMRTVKQNLLVGFALTHVLGIVLALLQLLTPIQAAVFHAIPDFLILLNAARLIRFKS